MGRYANALRKAASGRATFRGEVILAGCSLAMRDRSEVSGSGVRVTSHACDVSDEARSMRSAREA